MFRRTATRGRNVSIVSSWKLDTSTTPHSYGSSAAAASGVPRLPPTKTRPKAREAISPRSVVTVDLPFVPATAATCPRKRRYPSSSSPHSGVPARRSASSGSLAAGTPGDRTTRSAPDAALASGRPRTNATCGGMAWPRDVSTDSFGRSSNSVTRAPSRRRTSAATNPDRPAPTTTAFFPPKVSISPDLERAHGEKRQDDGDDPEADDDLRLGPALELEVVVDRGHAEDALARRLVREHLEDDRQRLHHEDPADQHEHDLLLDHDGDRAERGAD